jgi:heme exporter protein D
MGGYARFVWPAFAVTAIVMVALLVLSRRALRVNESTLEALQNERRGARERPAPAIAPANVAAPGPATMAESDDDA